MKRGIYTSRNTNPTKSNLTTREYISLENRGCTDIISGGTHFTDFFYIDEVEYILNCLELMSVTDMDLHIRLNSFEGYSSIRDPSNTEYQNATKNRVDKVLSELDEVRGVSFDVFVYPLNYYVENSSEQETGILEYLGKVYDVTQAYGVELSAEIGYYPSGTYRNLDVRNCSAFVDYFITELYGVPPVKLSTRTRFMNDLIGKNKNVIGLRTYNPTDLGLLSVNSIRDGLSEVVKLNKSKYVLYHHGLCDTSLYFLSICRSFVESRKIVGNRRLRGV